MLHHTPSVPTEQMLLLLEDCLDRYMAERRSRITPFVDRHFPLEETIAIQKRSFLSDLLCYPINTLWAIPYVFIKKTGDSLDKLGWAAAQSLVSIVPSGMKRRYQLEMEPLLRAHARRGEAPPSDSPASATPSNCISSLP